MVLYLCGFFCGFVLCAFYCCLINWNWFVAVFLVLLCWFSVMLIVDLMIGFALK